MSFNRYEWLMITITFYDHKTIRTDFPENRFARMRWFVTEFARNHYCHNWFIVIDKTL